MNNDRSPETSNVKTIALASAIGGCAALMVALAFADPAADPKISDVSFDVAPAQSATPALADAVTSAADRVAAASNAKAADPWPADESRRGTRPAVH